jgi:hypothetical protein
MVNNMDRNTIIAALFDFDGVIMEPKGIHHLLG